MKPLLYLETTIPSYLTSKPSRDLIVAARQRTTLDWWLKRQHDFQVFVSQIVLDEAADGDRQAAAARLSVIETVPLLAINDEVISLAQIPAHVELCTPGQCGNIRRRAGRLCDGRVQLPDHLYAN